VLRVLLEFAAGSFDRVAAFALAAGEARGLAQRGLVDGGGPDDVDLRHVRFPADEPAWFRRVLAGRAPLRAAPEDEGDRDLASRLGSAVPTEAYLAPIESGGRVVAVLYADNLPTRRPLPDTSALEVVLHEAGLALARSTREPASADEQAGAAGEA
jgi:hypothetical protein